VRIEPAEIEAALLDQPGIRAAAVVLHAGEPPAGPHLVAFFVADPETEVPEPQVLRAALAGSLPAAMLPAAFAALPELPRTANGKLDRRALARLAPAVARSAEPVAPRTSVERLLAGFFADLLGVGQIGVHDDFFALGGHSLQGMRLIAKIREAFGIDVKVRTLFESPTVAGLAVAIADELIELVDDEIVTAALESVRQEVFHG
jgi:aryl carrier-like protein